MVKTTVQAAGLVGAGFLRRGGRNGWLCGGAPLAAGGHLTMVHFGVRTRAEETKGSLEWADPGIGAMTKSPAVSALGKANTFLSGVMTRWCLPYMKDFPTRFFIERPLRESWMSNHIVPKSKVREFRERQGE